jgi:membrane associated rhomboid family serine protease
MDDSASPTLTLALLMVVVVAVQTFLRLFGVDPWTFALTWPLTERPWTLLTSVFAHAGFGHLLSNLVGLAILGLLLERRTSPVRFYAFFLATGIVAGVMQVTVATLVLGRPAAVLGASGAVFALFGYVLAGNRLTKAAASGISIRPRTQLLAIVIVAVVLTLVTAGQRDALIAHFTGLVLGIVAGREHLLRPGRSEPADGMGTDVPGR